MLFIKPYTQCSIVHYTVGVHDGRFSEGGKEYEYIYKYIFIYIYTHGHGVEIFGEFIE